MLVCRVRVADCRGRMWTLGTKLSSASSNLCETACEGVCAAGLIQIPWRRCPLPSEGLGQDSSFIRGGTPVLFILLSIKSPFIGHLFCAGSCNKKYDYNCSKHYKIDIQGAIRVCNPDV